MSDPPEARLAALGLVNACGLLVWLIADRRTPQALDLPFLAFWLLPWIAEVVIIHIGKPGYVLPLAPALALILAAFYARRGVAWLIAMPSAPIPRCFGA